jgi:hypothetical protein
LPFPANPAFPGIILEDRSKQLLEQTLGLPSMKPFMQHTTRNRKPLLLDGLPLATRPQHIPDAIQNFAIISPGASWLFLLASLRKMLSQDLPQFVWGVAKRVSARNR